jgi:hypothetical protein
MRVRLQKQCSHWLRHRVDPVTIWAGGSLGPESGDGPDVRSFVTRQPKVTARLFECIGVGRRDCCPMKKGSPQDYTAEIGCSKQPTQKSRLGEPHECYSLYRIRRSQENYQLLRKNRRRPHCGGRHITSTAYGTTTLGRKAGNKPGMGPWKPHCSAPGSTTP